MKRFLIFIALLSQIAFGQNFNITNELSFGGSSWDILQVIPDASGTGYYFYGSSNSSGTFDHQSTNYGNSDIWLIRTDLDYTILWDKTYGGSGNDTGLDAVILNNHLYLGTTSDSPISGNKTLDPFGSKDVWLLKLDLDGAIIWQKTYGGLESESSVRIEAYQNQILMYTTSYSNISGNITTTNQGLSDCWVALINPTDGAINDQTMIGSSSEESTGGLEVIDDRIFIITNTYGDGGDIPELQPGFGLDIVLFELNASLDIIQTKGYYGNSSDFARRFIKKSDNEYFLITESQSSISGDKTSDPFGSNDIWLLKLDANFNVVWDTIYGGSYYDVSTPFAHIDDNGSLVLAGISNSAPGTGNKMAPIHGHDDIWILIINTANGDVIAEASFGGNEPDHPTELLPLGNGKLLIVGGTESGISGNKNVPLKGIIDAWIIETDASNYLNAMEIEANRLHKFYPNPVLKSVTLDLKEGHDYNEIRFFAADSREILFRAIKNGETTLHFDFTGTSGLIFYTLSGTSETHSGRIMKLKY